MPKKAHRHQWNKLCEFFSRQFFLSRKLKCINSVRLSGAFLAPQLRHIQSLKMAEINLALSLWTVKKSLFLFSYYPFYNQSALQKSGHKQLFQFTHKWFNFSCFDYYRESVYTFEFFASVSGKASVLRWPKQNCHIHTQ